MYKHYVFSYVQWLSMLLGFICPVLHAQQAQQDSTEHESVRDPAAHQLFIAPTAKMVQDGYVFAQIGGWLTDMNGAPANHRLGVFLFDRVYCEFGYFSNSAKKADHKTYGIRARLYEYGCWSLGGGYQHYVHLRQPLHHTYVVANYDIGEHSIVGGFGVSNWVNRGASATGQIGATIRTSAHWICIVDIAYITGIDPLGWVFAGFRYHSNHFAIELGTAIIAQNIAFSYTF